MSTYAQCFVRARLGSEIAALRRRLVGAGHARAAVEFGIILTIALLVLVVVVQFAFTGEAARALVQANYKAARSSTENPAANQSAVPRYIADHIDDAFRA